ncbi:hypothetical protein C453_09958 [Haloferax elongans ATCC BAA-1513]|uniref:Uncharacterized protein n=1 Tax=Haloferax elongans ATCC BAA-1513 TaxID=1230453 RepID=M0HQV9_HALEO|nr:hypothetical protein [Haloferax elongans]ELZ86133.1 hypothetical protein C453_09958 [Haloferax elongans ATCC BAA-1513]
MTRNENRSNTPTRMRDVSHTNPYTGETFTTVYERGPAVTDGGAVDSTDSSPAMTGGSDTMDDVDHTPPHGNDTNRVWNRGRTELTDHRHPGETGGNPAETGDVDE